MKRAKKLIWLLVTAAVFATAPLTAMALPAGGYVPTTGTWYYQDSSTKKWVKDYKVSFSYKKDGRLTKVTQQYVDAPSVYTTAYTWKGNYITKINYKNNYYDEFGLTTYKYKNKKLTSYGYGEGNVQKYKWKGKTGTYSQTWDGGSYTNKFTINAKGQLVKETYKYKNSGITTTDTSTYKYYGNGNLKSMTSKNQSSNVDSYVVKYNQKGYKTSESYKSNTYTSKTTYKYKYKKGKLKEVVITSSGKNDGESFKDSSKIEFTKWKNVSHIRNCDAWGHVISLW